MATDLVIVQASIVVDGTPFRVLSYTLQEGLFDVGSLACEVVHDDEDPPDPATVVGKVAALTLARTDGSQKRYYHGIVASAERRHDADDVHQLRLVVVPHMWRLGKRADCRIFQKKSVVDVVKAVLTGGGVADQQWDVTGTYAPRDYVVQYRETDLQFAMRACSENGIYFWVEHTADKDTVRFSDEQDGVGTIDGTTSLWFNQGQGHEYSADWVMHVSHALSVRSDKVTLRDFDPDKPKVLIEGAVEGTDAGQHDLEVYAFPARTPDKAEAKRLAQVTLDSIQADRDVVSGEVGVLTLEPGKRFSIQDHPYAPLNGEYLVTALRIDGASPRQFGAQGVADGGAAQSRYQCTFEGIAPDRVKYRPPRAPRPAIMPGLQTAISTGPSGQEIYTDAGARVKAQFHWDRLGKTDDQSSRWMRTSQMPLGGSMLIPRMKWEVAVTFNEGDADDPYVMARMYNVQTPPPYELPKNKARSSLQTVTTPGGGSVNEFRTDDSKGSEEMFMNASKDMSVDVGNSTTEQVGVDCERSIGSNQKINVTNSFSSSVGANQTVTVSGNQSVNVETFMVDQVTGAHQLSINGNRTMMVGGDHKRDVTGDSSLTIDGMMLDAVVGNVTDSTLADYNHKVGGAFVEMTAGSRSYTVGGARNEQSGAVKIIGTKGGVGVTVSGELKRKVAGAIINSVTKDKTEHAGGDYMEIAAGAHLVKCDSIVMEAETMLTLVMGASTLTLMPSMVALAGVSVKMDGDTVDTAPLILDN